MTTAIQCDNCGAVLLQEDVFCGECGAPRPQSTESIEPETGETPPTPDHTATDRPPHAPARPQPVRPSAASDTGWRVAFIVLVVLGAFACVAGIATFLLFGATSTETTTPAEDWLYSAICCLLPIGGTGTLLAAIGGVIWYTRLRSR